MRSIDRVLLSSVAPTAIVTAIALALGQQAIAAALEIDNERTTPVSTSTAVGSGPGDVEITDDGSIEVSTGPAVVIDSNNDVINNGTIELTSDTNAMGVRIVGPVLGSFTNNGTMTLAVRNSSGVATGSGNMGVQIAGPGTYAGDIVFGSNSSLLVGGDNAIGLVLLTPMSGQITIGGAQTLDGTNVTAVLLSAPLEERFKIEGTITVRGEGARGIWIESPVLDRVWNNGSISVSGQESGISYDTDALRPSAQAAFGIGASLSRGFQNGGFIDESGGSAAASITSEYAPFAMLISPIASSAPSDLVLTRPGGTGGEYGFINRGTISSSAKDKGEGTTALRIEGANVGGTTYETTIDGGFYSSGTITSTAVEGIATSLSLGSYASMPALINKGSITASSSEHADSDDDEDAADLAIDTERATAIALQIDALASLPELQNSGSITATAAADSATAYAIRDLSGSLTAIYNSGTISATGTDDNDTATSASIAIDLSLSPSVTIENPGSIYGDVLLGKGNDTVNLMERVQGSSGDDELDGSLLFGVIDFAQGDDVLTIDDDSHFKGGTRKSAGTLAIDVIDGRVTVAADATLNATRVNVSGTSDMVIAIDKGSVTSPRVVVSDAITFASGSDLTADLTEFVGRDTDITLIDASTIGIAAGLGDLASTELPFLYNGEFSIVHGARDQLVLSLNLKSPDDLGLSVTEARMYDAVIEIMSVDDNVLGGLLTTAADKESFRNAYDELVPDTSAGTIYAALSLNDARSRALLSRHMVQPTAGSSKNKAVWANTFGYMISMDGTDGRPGTDGSTVGAIMGADFKVENKSAYGLYLEYGNSSFSPDDGSSDETGSDTVGTGFYGIWHTSELVFASVDVGVGYTHNEATRGFAFDQDGDDVVDLTYGLSSDWDGINYHAEARAGYVTSVYGLRVVPSVGYSYVHVSEGGHAEEGAGVGLDLVYDDFEADVHRLELELSIGDVSKSSRGVVFAYDIYGRYHQTLSGADNVLSAHFSGGSETFTLPVEELPQSQAIVGTNVGWYGTRASFTASYEFDLANGSFRHGGSLNVVFKF